MSNLEEKQLELLESMDLWFENIKAILNKKIEKQPLTRNTPLVEGHSLEDLDNIINDLIGMHLEKVNEHELTLDQLGVLSSTEVDNRLRYFQNSFNIPLTNIPDLSNKTFINWDSGKITISELGDVVFLGRTFNTPPQMSTTMPSVDEFYINLNFSNHTSRPSERSCSISTSNGDNSLFSIPVLKVNKLTKNVYGRKIVMLRTNEISEVPIAGGIPVSSGNQSLPGSINVNWYGG